MTWRESVAGRRARGGRCSSGLTAPPCTSQCGPGAGSSPTTMAIGQRQRAWDISTVPSGTEHPNGVWSNGDITWILDAAAKAVYAYATAN